MIYENELIKSLEDLTNEYRDKQANAKNEKHNAFLTGALGILIDVTNMVRHWPKRRNRMTNLEYYKDEIKEEFLKHHYLGDVVYRVASNNGYKFYRNSEDDINLIDWLLEEHKEPIKLKQWEYDLIRTNDRPHECNVFESFNTYRNMKAIGYFEGITDTSMTLKEILENCEVVE